MTGSMVTDATLELITMVEVIYGDGMALSLLMIHKGVAHIWGVIGNWIL